MLTFTRVPTTHLGVRLNPRKKPELLRPGTYWRLPFSGTRVRLFPANSSILRLPGQEIPTQDQVPVKVTCAVTMRYVNPAILVTKASDGEDFLTATLIDILHSVIREAKVEELVGSLSEYEKALFQKMSAAAAALGVELEEVRIRNLVLPRSLKHAYTAEAAARVEAKAKLEMARSQTAALRHLANAAKLVEDQPELIQLLALQSAGVQLGLPVSRSKEK